MTLKKSTKTWLVNFAVSALVAVAIWRPGKDLGCVGSLAAANAVFSCLVLLAMVVAKLFRLAIRRLALRLAFSYFLIGVVPIPLLAALLSVVAYLLASQLIGTRVRREAAVVVETAAASHERLPGIMVEGGKIATSDVDWLRPGDDAAWAERVDVARPLIAGGRIWFAARPDKQDRSRIALVALSDPSTDFLQRLADRTGYEVRLATGRGERRRSGWEFRTGNESRKEWKTVTRPRGKGPAGVRWLEREWLVGVSVERAIAVLGTPPGDQRLVVIIGRTCPITLFEQLFAQGVPEVGRTLWGIIAGLAVLLFLVYAVALAIAFTLIGSIARSVNRLTRATRAMAGGDFSVRIQSESRDQIGDLSRSFDGMAASIQKLLLETAEKERLEAEIAIARTIQQELLPPAQAQLPGLELLAHFQPVAEIGGDYYDYFAMPDGRTAVAVGDVSGHGLPTGLLAAMAKAALTTQIESGLTGSGLFARLNDLIHRSTDSRNYMTLGLLAYDAVTREVELTNAGQLAPYRLSGGQLSSFSLPSFPLGASPRAEFPTASYELASSDRLVFLTDGFIEAANAAGEPFGFERLEALFRTEASSDAERLKDALLAAVAAHTAGAPPDDDRTLVILTIA